MTAACSKEKLCSLHYKKLLGTLKRKVASHFVPNFTCGRKPRHRSIKDLDAFGPNGLSRVLARILKMPVQNSNFKISARPDLATNLLQILIPATINSLVCQ